MSFTNISSPALALLMVGFLTGHSQAEGDRGHYGSFGLQKSIGSGLSIQKAASEPLTVTKYRASSEKSEKFQVVDQESAVQFRLVGLPAGVQQKEYHVSWKFDENHHGALQNMLEPEETTALKIRYNTANSNHRVVELRVASADGQWKGSTKFPISARIGDSPEVGDDNVLLVRMTPTSDAR